MNPIVALLLVVLPASAQSPIADMTPTDLARGERLFRVHCARCHGIQGEGGEGANLNDPLLRYAPDDETLFTIISNGIPGTGMPSTFAPGADDLWKIAAYVRSLGDIEYEEPQGNVEKGRELFATKGRCTTCHIAVGQGTGIGPELTDVGARRGLDYLRQSLVDPGATAPRGATALGGLYLAYLTVRVRSSDGRDVEGVRVNEDAFTIQVRDLNGRLHSVRKHDVVAIDKVFGHSMMPEYEATLSPDELDDVISYLLTLRGES